MSESNLCDLLIHNAFLITVDSERHVYAPGAVAVRDHSLVAVGPEREVMARMTAARTLDVGGSVVHPGFIDAHNHMVGAGCRGVFANDSSDPVSGVNFAAWKADVTGEDEAVATALTGLQMLHNGYTGVVEAGTVFDTQGVAEAVRAVGIRTCLAAPYLWDTVEVMQHLGALESPALFARAPANFERCVEELGSQLHLNDDPDGALHGFVCLYGIGTATDELERRAKALADEHRVILHQHDAYEPSSTAAETERLGHSRIVHLAELGVLDQRSTLVHMNTLTDEDVDIVAQSGCSVVWCPGGYISMGLAGTVACRMPEMLDRGVNVTLGSDSARNSTIGDEALTSHLVAANAGRSLSPETILEMQTINAARSAGLDKITGSLEVGKRADLVVANAGAPEAYPGANPVQQLALTSRAGHARMVLVNGEIVIEDGRSTRMDEQELFAKANASIRQRIERLGLGPAMQWTVS